ncbi:MAG: energy-coupling factor ABC transporter permease [Halobacteriota archaeon]|jgi:cobalt/nickel transport system permease protein
MALIHLPDGAFSIQFLIFWWILAAVLITTALLLARRQTITAERLSITAMVTAASFAVFPVSGPFASRDLADYNAHTEGVRQ